MNKYQYSPFGETASLSGTIFGFTGQRYDAEVALYNYKSRYYAPSIGRFLQKDPLGYSGGGMNLYGYVGNDPANNSDPMGLSATLQGGISVNVPVFTPIPGANPFTSLVSNVDIPSIISGLAGLFGGCGCGEGGSTTSPPQAPTVRATASGGSTGGFGGRLISRTKPEPLPEFEDCEPKPRANQCCLRNHRKCLAKCRTYFGPGGPNENSDTYSRCLGCCKGVLPDCEANAGPGNWPGDTFDCVEIIYREGLEDVPAT